MWLTERLAPDFKTIADFRRDNSTGKEQQEQEQRQHDQPIQYLQSELRKVTDTLTGKQQELMRAQQEGVRLIGDLTRVQAELHQAQEELRTLRPHQRCAGVRTAANRRTRPKAGGGDPSQ